MPRQRVTTVLDLHGVQDTAVAAHHRYTEEATVSVRIGRALIYFHDWAGAAAVMRGWRELSHYAVRLPLAGSAGTASRSTSEPPSAIRTATAINVIGTPSVVGQLRAPPGKSSTMVMRIDGLGVVIHDRNAYYSTREAFIEAEALAARVLPKPAVPDLQAVAMDRAARALAPPRGSVSVRRAAEAGPALQSTRRTPTRGMERT